VVIDWTATWCGPCKQIKPIFEALSEAHSSSLFIKADVDELGEVNFSKCFATQQIPQGLTAFS